MQLYYMLDTQTNYYLTKDYEPTDKRTEAAKFTKAQLKAHEFGPGWVPVPVGEDVKLRAAGAPMLPGIGDE